MKAGDGNIKGENGREDSARGGRETTGGGQHPTSNTQHPTSKREYGREDSTCGSDAMGGDGQRLGSGKAEKQRRRTDYDLEERILAYAVRVVRLVDRLPKSRGGDHLGGQLLRSGTSPALNHGEVQAAESLNDFVHKMKICLKELRESRRTLRIIEAVPLAKELDEIKALIHETEELIRIFFAGIRTALTKREPTARVREGAAESNENDSSTDTSHWMLDVGTNGSTSDPSSKPEETPQ